MVISSINPAPWANKQQLLLLVETWCLTLHHAILSAVKSCATNFLHLSLSLSHKRKHTNNPLSNDAVVWQPY